MQNYWAIGLMTGTALDGFADVALIRTDGEKVIELGDYMLVPYSDTKREILSKAVSEAREWKFIGEQPAIFADATLAITDIYVDAVKAILAKSGKSTSDIKLIGAHGLTVLHVPPHDGLLGNTLQLLDGDRLAALTGIKTIYDFRTNDVKHGGQGAPLAPIYHAAMLRYAQIAAPAAVLNLGGVANLTYWGGNDDLAAFDCGPANGPINELVENFGQGTYDKDGGFASKGVIHFEIINKVLSAPWFSQNYPKSLDRYDYSAKIVEGLSLEDGCATLTELVAQAVNLGLGLFDKRPKTLVIAGGGRKNPVLMNAIANATGVKIIDADKIGLRGDAVEAECFAFLGVRSVLGLPISFPTTTGSQKPLCGGKTSATS